MNPVDVWHFVCKLNEEDHKLVAVHLPEVGEQEARVVIKTPSGVARTFSIHQNDFDANDDGSPEGKGTNLAVDIMIDMGGERADTH